MGGFIGAAIGFYLDASQVAVVVAKYHRYLAVGPAAAALRHLSVREQVGHLELGMVTGGVSLLLMESLAGVINFSTAAWLFAINRTFMRAYFWKDATPIRTLFTGEGLVQVGENMIQVLRWGLWMSPIINSFLRPMGGPYLVQPGRRDPHGAGHLPRCDDDARCVPGLEPAGLRRPARV